MKIVIVIDAPEDATDYMVLSYNADGDSAEHKPTVYETVAAFLADNTPAPPSLPASFSMVDGPFAERLVREAERVAREE